MDGWIDGWMELYYYIPYLPEHFIRAIGQLSSSMYLYLYLYLTCIQRTILLPTTY